MRLKDLNTGHRIEYTFIENDQLKYAQTQVFETIEGLNQRLSELHESKPIQSALVVKVHYFDKSIT